MIDYNRKSFIYKRMIDDLMGILGVDYTEEFHFVHFGYKVTWHTGNVITKTEVLII